MTTLSHITFHYVSKGRLSQRNGWNSKGSSLFSSTIRGIWDYSNWQTESVSFHVIRRLWHCRIGQTETSHINPEFEQLEDKITLHTLPYKIKSR